jgi:tRNA1Val (adenine37-N6)-methyltransferase
MLFKFKQFQVDQSGCAMKINTDGVLLGALAGYGAPKNILDIGTGTGVIAMMMAQRFTDAIVEAVEIDLAAADTAFKNFQGSSFADRLNLYAVGFTEYFDLYPEKQYDLIISNPPFYINSLEAATDKKNLAKHTNAVFFEWLIKALARHVSDSGTCWLVLPLPTANLVKQLANRNQLYIQQQINIRSFADSDTHREIMVLGKHQTKPVTNEFIIYNAPKVYSAQYRTCLKDFFTIF